MNSWSFFSRRFGEGYRNQCANSIVAGGGNSIIVLLSNNDPDAPVNFFEKEYGGHIDMNQLNLLESWARKIAQQGGALWPTFFCDGDDNSSIRNAPIEVHQRAFSLLIAHLRPYVPGFVIGIESSEYFSTERHNEFISLIHYLAPDRFVAAHMQRLPKSDSLKDEDGEPKAVMPNIDAWFYEHSWHPGEGNDHSAVEVVNEAMIMANIGKYIWPVEYNLDCTGSAIRYQSQALLAAGFGCGGPI